jgi:hypothetical protein
MDMAAPGIIVLDICNGITVLHAGRYQRTHALPLWLAGYWPLSGLWNRTRYS